LAAQTAAAAASPSPLTLPPRLLLLLFLRGAWSISFNALFTVFSLFLTLRFGLPAASTGSVLSYAGALQIAVQAFCVAPVTRAVPEDRLLLAALAVAGCCLAALATVPSVPLLCLVLAPTAVASALFQTTLSAALSKAAAPAETGALLGLAFSVEAGARVVAPVIAGALISAAGPSAPGLFGAALVAVALPVAAAAMRRPGAAASLAPA